MRWLLLVLLLVACTKPVEIPLREPDTPPTCGSGQQTVYNDEGEHIGCIRIYG